MTLGYWFIKLILSNKVYYLKNYLFYGIQKRNRKTSKVGFS